MIANEKTASVNLGCTSMDVLMLAVASCARAAGGSVAPPLSLSFGFCYVASSTTLMGPDFMVRMVLEELVGILETVDPQQPSLEA